MAEEIELKLAIGAAAATRLAHAGAFGPPSAHEDLRSTYFDTPSETLRKAGLSLRVRTSGKRHVQTIKRSSGMGAGLIRRGEWDKLVKGVEPVPDQRSGMCEVLARAGEDLVPVFTITVHREIRDLVESGARIEMAVDHGRIAAAHRSEQFHEVELELMHGDIAALFALARRIGTLTTARIGVSTKAWRGWSLLAETPEAVRAEPLKLDPTMSVGAAFVAIAGACVLHYRRNEDILLDRPTVEAVHQARVALRQLRTAIHAFRAILPGKELPRFAERLRRLALTLGSVRDLDVMIEQTGPGILRERMIASRDVAWTRLRRRLGARASRELLLDIVEWLQCGAWREDTPTLSLREEPLRLFAAKTLDQLRKRVHRHGHHFGKLTDEGRHRVRKDVKKLRYNSEFFLHLFDKKRQRKHRKPFLKAMNVLQDDLGILNDLCVAKAWLAAEGLSETPEAQAWIETIQERQLLKHTEGALHELLDAKAFWR
jgi:inorganic triphosphatase YgiF